VLEQNEFLARSLANGVKHGLAESDRAAYYAPYPDRASRRPMLQWPREIPIEGEPADVAAVITRNGEWLATTPALPKLLLTFDGPGSATRPTWSRGRAARSPSSTSSPSAPLDTTLLKTRPRRVAGAIRSWLDRTSSGDASEDRAREGTAPRARLRQRGTLPPLRQSDYAVGFTPRSGRD